jgi:hypothetical protein
MAERFETLYASESAPVPRFSLCSERGGLHRAQLRLPRPLADLTRGSRVDVCVGAFEKFATLSIGGMQL